MKKYLAGIQIALYEWVAYILVQESACLSSKEDTCFPLPLSQLCIISLLSTRWLAVCTHFHSSCLSLTQPFLAFVFIGIDDDQNEQDDDDAASFPFSSEMFHCFPRKPSTLVLSLLLFTHRHNTMFNFMKHLCLYIHSILSIFKCIYTILPNLPTNTTCHVDTLHQNTYPKFMDSARVPHLQRK